MNILAIFKRFIAGQYESVLGMALSDNSVGDGHQPIWIEDKDGAWLLDQDVGLALLVVPYLKPKQDLNRSIQQALSTATSLAPRGGLRESEADKRGAWQVAVLWLVGTAQLAASWRSAIAVIRQESGLSEEVALDAVLAAPGLDFESACVQHGVPQLLLHTRRLFDTDSSAMPAWLSANGRVTEMLSAFPTRFSSDRQTERLARDLVEEVLGPDRKHWQGSADPMQRKSLPELSDLEIWNFRNIRHVRIRFPREKNRAAQAHIVFGPNGTGKTSIFEALCLALGGTSKTWEEFDSDPDIEGRARDYPSMVLSPLGVNTTARVSINGTSAALTPTRQVSWRDLDGTFLGQEDSRDFLGADADSLGQRVLKGYSTLADQILQKASLKERQARDEKSNWLRQHGLSAAISRRETRAQRLIESELQRESWIPPGSVFTWLEKGCVFLPGLGNEGPKLASRWRQWQNQLSQVVADMAAGVLVGEPSLVQTPIAAWLAARNELLIATRDLVSRATALIAPIRDELSAIETELDAWAEWLTRQSQAIPATDDERKRLLDQITQTNSQLIALRKSFAVTRDHFAYLGQVRTDFLPKWTEVHPSICPTCGEDHSRRGGIAPVIESIFVDVEKQLGEMEARGKATSADLAKLHARLAALGHAPISEERQKELSAMLAPFAPGKPLQSVLSTPTDRAALRNNLRDIQVLPDVQLPISADAIGNVTNKLAERSLSLDAEAERLWPLPERWAAILRGLKEECDKIVADHLPATLQKVWWEVTQAITAARWNVVGNATLHARAQGKLIVSLQERSNTPARYLFNQAERHIGGLAWFFVRYLTHGRFHHGLMVMDDPAQEMDQTTFRSFGRFIQSFLRIHEARQKVVQFVVLLHQEDRALDLARATMGRFVMLTWFRSIESTTYENLREMRLFSEGFFPQSAPSLLLPKASAPS